MILRLHPAARPLLLLGALAALAGCARSWTAPPAPRHTHELALVSSLGEEAGLKLTAVDGQRLDGASTAREQPVDVAQDFDPRMGLWLASGAYVLGVQYVRNIEAGISLTQADVPVRVRAGRTYLLRPQVTSDYAVASFTLADHGAAFPLRCLPWTLRQARLPDARGRRAPLSRADIESCRQAPAH